MSLLANKWICYEIILEHQSCAGYVPAWQVLAFAKGDHNLDWVIPSTAQECDTDCKYFHDLESLAAKLCFRNSRSRRGKE